MFKRKLYDFNYLRCDLKMVSVMKYVVEVGLALLFAGIFIPMGLQYIATANLTGVNALVAQFFTIVMPIMVVIGVGLKFMPEEIKGKVGI